LAGFVPPAELPWLYRHAFCTVMASSYEGMPFAVLEALAAGSRVVLSDIPAHRELGLGTESYFPVGDVVQLRARLVRQLDGEPGAPPAALDARFEWDRIAEATAAVLDAAAARTARGAAAAAQRRAGGP
jgi:glycosyltransferase involved in cell wall biosynthesis